MVLLVTGWAQARESVNVSYAVNQTTPTGTTCTNTGTDIHQLAAWISIQHAAGRAATLLNRN